LRSKDTAAIQSTLHGGIALQIDCAINIKDRKSTFTYRVGGTVAQSTLQGLLKSSAVISDAKL
jgi:hypothetical protein